MSPCSATAEARIVAVGGTAVAGGSSSLLTDAFTAIASQKCRPFPSPTTTTASSCTSTPSHSIAAVGGVSPPTVVVTVGGAVSISATTTAAIAAAVVGTSLVAVVDTGVRSARARSSSSCSFSG